MAVGGFRTAMPHCPHYLALPWAVTVFSNVLLDRPEDRFLLQRQRLLVAPFPFFAGGLPVGVPEDALVVPLRHPFKLKAMVLGEFFSGLFRTAGKPTGDPVGYLGT